MKVKDYAKLINRSEQFVRIACQQGQIPCIVIKHKKRHVYEILEEGSIRNEKEDP